MSPKRISIKVHGEILREFIMSKSSIEAVAESLGLSRQMIHAYTSKGLISPASLAKLVTFLKLSSDDVTLLDRQRETEVERLLSENRRLKDALCEIRKSLEQVL